MMNAGVGNEEMKNEDNLDEIQTPESHLSVEFDENQNSETIKSNMIYGIQDRPPWISMGLMGLQHYSITFSGILTMPLILAVPTCFSLDRDLTSQLIGTSFFISGLTTFLQTGLGSRLPIVQGPSLAMLIPAMIMMGSKQPCPSQLTVNSTDGEIAHVREVALERILEIQGSICLASVVQILIGFTGLIGIFMMYVGPITIATTLILIGIPLMPWISNSCGTHVGISVMCIVLIVIFSQFLDKYDIPCPRRKKFSLFTMFPIILAVAITWVVCLILTAAGVFPDDPSEYGFKARTDTYNKEIQNSVWVRLPYPGQWGTPTISIGGFIGMLAGVLASILESIGDYHACAMISEVPPPPVHAINRGIAMEGLGAFIGAICGSGVGFTSYSNNVAAIGITKVASRSVIYISAILFMISGIFAKFNAVCAGVPEPIIGATMAVTFGMLISIGIANLNQVKMNTSRNLFIVGFAITVGIVVPDYMMKNPDAINTRSDVINHSLNMILNSQMLIGGVVACVLDNLVRGTSEERGIYLKKGRVPPSDHAQTRDDCYDLPFGMKWIRKHSWTRYFPFSPTFSVVLSSCRKDRSLSRL